MKFPRSALAIAGAAVAVTLMLSACSGGSGGSSGGTAADAKQTINVWGWSGSPGATTMDKIIKAYEKVNPNVTVKYNEILNTSYQNKLTLGLSSKASVDVVAIMPNASSDSLSKYLLPVSKYPGQSDLMSDFQPSAVAQDKKLWSDGVVRAVPYGSSGTDVGFYNADMMKAAGFSTPPTTWAQWAKFVAALKVAEPDVAPAVIPSDNWVQNDIVMTLAGSIQKNYFNDFRYDKAKWDTPTLVKALTTYQDLYQDGSLDKATIDLKYADAMQAFDTGKAAVAFTGTWEAGRLLASYRQANHLAASDVGVMPMPATTAGTGGIRSFLDVTYGIPTASTHQAAAADFITFATAGAGVKVWGPLLGDIPSEKGFVMPSGVLTTPLDKSSYALLQKLNADPNSDRNVLSDFENQQGVYDLEVAAGTMTPKAAAEQGQSDFDSGKYQ